MRSIEFALLSDAYIAELLCICLNQAPISPPKVRQTNQGAGHLCGREPVRAGVSAGHRHGQMKKAAALEESRVAAFYARDVTTFEIKSRYMYFPDKLM
jgi:hypothetical protein